MTNTTTVTVFFTDGVGNTALRRGLGDAAAERLGFVNRVVPRDRLEDDPSRRPPA